MKVLVVGLGSIARRHIKNLHTIDSQIQIAVLRQHSKTDDLGDINGFVSNVFLKEAEALAWKPDVVLVTNPASMHVKTALAFAKIGCDLFIEKPLSDKQKDMKALLALCRRRKLIVMLGYVMRFYEPLNIIKTVIDQGRIGKVLHIRAHVGQYLPAWRPEKEYQKTVSAQKELGGGAILELSHELDYVRWLLGEIKEVCAFSDKLSNLDMDVEDVADIVLRFEKNVLGYVHLDMLDCANNRSCRIVGSEGTLVLDSQQDFGLRLYSAKTKEWEQLWRQDEHYDYNRVFIQEMKHFLDCVKKRQEPKVSLNDGVKILDVILAIKKSSIERKVIKL